MTEEWEGIEDDVDTEKDFDTGPFCRHFHDPSDCEKRCTCGCACKRHGYGDDSECMDCGCMKWEEVDNDESN